MKEKTKKLVEAFGFLYIDEAQLLMDVADVLKPGAIVVNVGAGVGTSALAILEQRPDLAPTFYTVDKRDDDNPFGGMLNELHAFQNAKMTHLLPHQIKGDSSAVGRAWGEKPIDFLIIDADHSAAGLLLDMEAWLPHLAIGGFVAFHDYHTSKWPDVYDVIEDTIMKDDRYDYVEVRDTMILFCKAYPKLLSDEDFAVEENEPVAYIEPEQTAEKTKAEAVTEKKPTKRRKSAKTTEEPAGE